MCAVTVLIFINITCGYRDSPLRTALEIDMCGVDAGVDDIYINALTASGIIFVIREGTEVELRTMTDACKALRMVLVDRHFTRP